VLEIDPATGVNWCSDCVTADPIIKASLIPKCEELKFPVLEVGVG